MFRGSRALIALLLIGCKPIEAITFTAKGCCPSCETSIFESLQIDAVKSAQWNQQHEKITLRYYPNEISADQLQLTVAMAGYDTDLFMAPDSVYLALPKCCHYRN
jgi:outer membrane receptor for ferrienterochelin and colicins